MHPCCNGSLQTGTKIIAIVELFLSILLCLVGVLTFFFGGVLTSTAFSDESDEELKTSPEDNHDAAFAGAVVMMVAVILIVAAAVYIFVGVVLLVGATKRNRTLCLVWFVLNVIFLILGVLKIFRDITSGDNKRMAVSSFLGTLVQSYFLWVVWAFMSELKEEAEVLPSSHPKPRV